MTHANSKSSGAKASISELARRMRLNRATVAGRLNAANIRPVSSKPTEKLYDIEAALPVLATGSGHDAREPSALTEARRRKCVAQTARLVVQLERERGTLIEVRSVQSLLYAFFRQMYLRLVKQFPRANARRLRQCGSEAAFRDMLEQRLASVFDELRKEHAALFGEDAR